MGKTQKRSAKTANKIPAALALRLAAQSAANCAPAPGPDGKAAKSLSLAERSSALTTALQETRIADALKMLQELRALNLIPRLGSVQRWVRLVDNCFLTMDAEKLQVMYALLYVINPSRTGRILSGEDALAALQIRVRYEEPALEGKPQPLEDAAAGHVDRDYRGASRVCFERAGPDRVPPNKHPLRIYAMDDSVFPEDPAWSQGVALPVPGSGARLVTNLITPAESAAMIACGEALGYDADEALTGSEAVPSNAFVWMCPPKLLARIFERIKPSLPLVRAGYGIPCEDPDEVLQPLGVNARFRSYRYETGNVYRPHFDGAWPSSGFDAEGNYVYDAESDRRSRITIVLYLNDDFVGGHTTFFYTDDDKNGAGGIVGRRVQPLRCAAVIFPHGDVFHAVHEGSAVQTGRKYIVRTEVLYSLPRAARRPGAVGSDEKSEPPSKKKRR